jgi:multiple sugar transport system ATP-binding protein
MAPITFEHVTKQFDDAAVVDDLSISVADGEFLVLVGPSGCGKTTALRMLAGLEQITSGRILIGDSVVNEVAPGDRKVAMVFQSYALYPHMTVYGNLAFSLRTKKVPKPEIERRVKEAAEVLGLGGLLERKPRQLSGGQRQRVALGRAIVREPAAFLMDEPLSNLDAALRVQTRAEILKLQKRLATTTIYVTHDQIEAMTMGDRIAVMKKGVLQQVGTPEEVYTSPANTFVATFIGSPAMNLVPSAMLDLGDARELVGIRPEHVGLANDKLDTVQFEAVAEVVEYLGNEQLVHIRMQDLELVVKLPAEPRLAAGQRAGFSVPLAKLSFFDAQTGEARGSSSGSTTTPEQETAASF